MSQTNPPKKLKTKHVFTPGGQPTVTYVDRAHLDLEGALKRAIARGYSIVSITGQTKSGKTVLCRKVIPPNEALWLEAGQIKDEGEFWAQAAHKLNIAHAVTKSLTKEQTDGASGEIGAGFNLGPISITGKGGGNIQDKIANTSSMTWSGHTKLQVLELLRAEDKPLIIDDFHYLPQALQRSVVQTLKAEVFLGLTVIFLSVPHRAFDPVTVEREMQGRFTHIEIPMWSDEDLSEIASSGFRALKVSCDKNVADSFAKEAFKSPLLMQNFCSSLCLDNGIFEECDDLFIIKSSREHIENIFTQVSTNFGFPTYQTLRRGPQSRTDRNKKTFLNGQEGDIYEAVLNAVALTGPLSALSYDDIRSALRQVLSEQSPQKHEVVRALGHMSKIAREDLLGEPVIEWDQKNGMLFITDPFLMFYMRWSIAKKFKKTSKDAWIRDFFKRHKIDFIKTDTILDTDVVFRTIELLQVKNQSSNRESLDTPKKPKED